MNSPDNEPVRSQETNPFDYSAIPEGFYQQVIETGNPIRRAWHMQKFAQVIECVPTGRELAILDIGCFSGTFLSLLSEEQFGRQMGVDILEKQTQYATRRFGTPYRSFRHIRRISDLAGIDATFDCVTLIEVIEHLKKEEIGELLRHVSCKVKKGGHFVMSTPNYFSIWPLLEIAVNRLSEVSYEEQHITKFNYFNCLSKLRGIYPALMDEFDLVLRTTTHFFAPFCAAVSLKARCGCRGFFPTGCGRPHWGV